MGDGTNRHHTFIDHVTYKGSIAAESQILGKCGGIQATPSRAV